MLKSPAIASSAIGREKYFLRVNFFWGIKVMRKITLLAVLCLALPSFLLAAPPPEKILKVKEKTLDAPTGISVIYEPKKEEMPLDSMIFLWTIENDFKKKTQWNCFIDESTKINMNGKPVSEETYSKWQEKGQSSASVEIKFDYSFHNKKLCREISLK